VKIVELDDGGPETELCDHRGHRRPDAGQGDDPIVSRVQPSGNDQGDDERCDLDEAVRPGKPRDGSGSAVRERSAWIAGGDGHGQPAPVDSWTRWRGKAAGAGRGTDARGPAIW